MTLSSLDIKNLLLNHKTFMGCYPCNRLPPFPKKQLPRSLIVNTDQSHESGNHWIAMILTRKNCLYFDSFGVGVLESDILKFIEEGYNSYIHSVKEIQAINSEKCGQFCVGFILQVTNVKTYASFLKDFTSKNKMENDVKVNQFLKAYLRGRK